MSNCRNKAVLAEIFDALQRELGGIGVPRLTALGPAYRRPGPPATQAECEGNRSRLAPYTVRVGRALGLICDVAGTSAGAPYLLSRIAAGTDVSVSSEWSRVLGIGRPSRTHLEDPPCEHNTAPSRSPSVS